MPLRAPRLYVYADQPSATAKWSTAGARLERKGIVQRSDPPSARAGQSEASTTSRLPLGPRRASSPPCGLSRLLRRAGSFGTNRYHVSHLSFFLVSLFFVLLFLAAKQPTASPAFSFSKSDANAAHQ